MNKSKKISILIPAYNEQPVLPILYKHLEDLGKKIKNYQLEFFFVDDGSSDKTLEIIKDYAKKDPRVAYISLSRNFGKEIAMMAGFDHIDADAMVIIDADLQDPPELIPKMIKYYEQGYDDVYAKRRSRAGESWLKKFTSKMFYKVLSATSSIPTQTDTGDFRLLSRRCIDALKQFRESERYTKGMFSWIGFKKKEILYDRDARAAGKTHWNYLKLTKLAVNGITSFTTTPLKLSTILGFVISVFAFIYLLWLLIRAAFFGCDLKGYSSMMVVILFLGGIQLISLGIIGEYVGQIFNETKKRPTYLIDEFHQSDKKDKNE